MPTQTKPQNTKAHAKTRLLLTLWYMGGSESAVLKGKLTERVKRSKEKAADYKSVFEDLEQAGAIAINKNQISLTADGQVLLGDRLQSSEFQFEGTQVGTKLANAVLQWLRQMGPVAASPQTNGKVAAAAIASYEGFKTTVLEIYTHLNRDYSYENLVPIYKIRREIGEQISRSQFNEWMLEMQADDIFQLMGGEMTDITPDKAEDSITTQLGGLRYYAQLLS